MGEKFWPVVERRDATGSPSPMNRVHSRPAVHFLKKGGDYGRVKKEGRRRQSLHFNLVYCSTKRLETRFGIVVGRRFGNAVKRNRAKRLVRELVRTTNTPFTPGNDCVIFPRRQILSSDYLVLKEAWLEILGREGILANS